MYAYSPNGSPIVGISDLVKGTSGVEDGSFTIGADGKIAFEHDDGGTKVDWDSQTPEMRNGYRLFIDDGGDLWPEYRLVLRETQLEEDEKLDPASVPPRQAPHQRIGGVLTVKRQTMRDPSSFDEREAAMLRPVAETIAMLEGEAMFGSILDADGDDALWRRRLPQAAALVAFHGAWASCASFARGPEPLAVAMARHHAPEGEEPVPLVSDPRDGARIVRIEGIRWDFDDGEDDAAIGDVPTSITAIVPADDGDPGQISDLLSERYGFCVMEIGSVAEQEPAKLAA